MPRPEDSAVRRRFRPDDEALDGLVATLYERAAEADGWDTCVRAFGDMLEGQAVCIHRYRPESRAGEAIRVLHGLTSEDADDYRRHHAAHNVWMEGLPGAPLPGDVIVSHHICPESELVRHRFYHDFLKPRGLFSMLAVVVGCSEEEFESVNILRGRRPGRYTDDEQLLARRLAPHLQALYRLHMNFVVERTRCTLLAEMLDRVPTAAFALGRELDVVEFNRAAARLLAKRDGVELVRGRVQTSDRAARDALRAAVGGCRETLSRGGGPVGTSFRIDRPSLAPPLTATVTPVRSLVNADGRQRARCLLFVDNSEEAHLPAAEQVIERFGLTPTEARVACLLASGSSPREIARALEISYNTVRCHLQHIFIKTDTSRQGEVVRLMTRLGMTAHDPGERAEV